MRSFMFWLSAITGIFHMTLNADTLRVATYNVWNPIFEERHAGRNTWNERLPYIVDTINSANSDVLALEEVGQEQYQDLVSYPDISSNYVSFYLPHAVSSAEYNEGRDGLALLFRPERVSLLQLVPSEDGSRPSHRRDFFADLEVRRSDDSPVIIRFAATHLDSGADLSVGNEQLTALVADVLHDAEDAQVDIAVVCGDFNEGEDELLRPRYLIMSRTGFVSDGSLDSTRPEALDIRHKGHVDWVYFKAISSLSYKLLPVTPMGDEKASDHKLTATDIVF